MAKSEVRKAGAVATIAALMALAAVPSGALAQDRGHGRWQGGRDGAAAAQGQARQEWRGNREARPSNGAEARRAQGAQAAAAQRGRAESNSAWRARGADGETARSVRAEQQAARQVRAERPPVEARRATPPQTRNPGVADVQRSRADRDWNRTSTPRTNTDRTNNNYRGARHDGDWNNRNRDWNRPNTSRPSTDRNNSNYRSVRRDSDWITRDRGRDGRGENWRDNDRRDPPRYNAGRVQSPRWDDDRRWSYSNGRYNWNRDWRSDKRYDWHRHRTTYRYVYSPGRYYSPYSSYYYRPLLVGNYLNSGFYGSSYWLSDPWEYRLPAAYGPYRWVRYFDDVLLVNIHNGMVVDVIRNFFW